MTPNPVGDRLSVWLLAAGLTFGYASLLYAFGALILAVQAGTGWAKTDIAFGLTLALLVAAATSPVCGRLVDRGWGAELLWGGAVLGGLALLALSQARSLPHWYMGWACVGPAMAASFYETCFAFLTRRLGPAAARPAIIRVTLVAGFASTLAFPLGAFVAAQAGWRVAFVTFAGIELALAAPLLAWAGRRLRRLERQGGVRPPDPPGRLRAALRTRRFWVIMAAFACGNLNHTMLATLFLPLAAGLAVAPATAVAAASLMGPAQVAGRLVLMSLGARAGALPATRTSFALLVLAAALLLAAGIELRLVFVFAAMQGAAIGLTSILRPLLVAEQLGSEGFGAISAVIWTGPLLATALGPLAGAALLEAGGPATLTLAGLAAAALGLALTLALRPRPA